MTFTAEQNAALAAKLDPAHVKSRSQSGRQLSYIESWLVIAEANRIFGFDGWSSETVDVKCVSERERKIGQNQRDGWGVTYTAKARVTVGDVVREGVGSGHGIDADLGQAHESAIKEAESDARKRALMTFGNPFGLALYDKTQANVGREQKLATTSTTENYIAPADLVPTESEERICSVLMDDLRKAKSPDDINAWKKDKAKTKLFHELPSSLRHKVQAFATERLRAVQDPMMAG